MIVNSTCFSCGEESEKEVINGYIVCPNCKVKNDAWVNNLSKSHMRHILKYLLLIIRRMFAVIVMTVLISLKSIVFMMCVLFASILEIYAILALLINKDEQICDSSFFNWITVTGKDVNTFKGKVIDCIMSVIIFISDED